MRNSKIVVQYASMWPREVCDLHDKDDKSLFIRRFTQPGVYVLYRDDHLYYIGKARQLGPRIWAHANHPGDKRYNFWNMFSAFVLSDKKYLDQVEGMLIAAMPAGNSAVPRIKKLPLPRHIVRQLRQIRNHQANPITRREFAKAIASLKQRQSLQSKH